MIGKNKKKKSESGDGAEQQNEGGPAPVDLAEFEALREEKQALEERLLRSQADLQNLRRRQLEELQRAREGVFERFLAELLPVVDALSFAEKAGTEGEELRQGFLMFKQVFEDLFARHGVQRLRPEGERFDPRRHEALAVEVREDVESGLCLTVHQDGLMLGDKVLRPARVVVSQKPAPEAPAESEAPETPAASDDAQGTEETRRTGGREAEDETELDDESTNERKD